MRNAPYRLLSPPRWLFLLFVLISEILVVTLRYDVGSVSEDQFTHGILVHATASLRLAFVIMLASALVAGGPCYRELAGLSVERRGSARLTVSVVGNLAAFVAFYSLSGLIFEGAQDQPSWSTKLVLALWLATGLVVVVCLALALLPAEYWALLLRRCWGFLLGGAVLGAIAYAAGELAQDQWQSLARGTFAVSQSMLKLGFADTVSKPEILQLGTTRFIVEIAPECSGYEGIGLITVLMSVSLWIFRRDLRFPRALALLPASMGLMWLANCVRIALLIAIGTWGYSDFAVSGFHSLTGWLMFLAVGLGMITWARGSRFLGTNRPIADDSKRMDAAYLVPVLTIIAISMVTEALSPGFDRYYAARVLGAACAIIVYRRSYTELRWSWSWQAVAVGCGVAGLWIVMEPVVPADSAAYDVRRGLATLPYGWAAWWLVFRIVGSVLIVPLAEELAFRGFLARRLISTDFENVSPIRLPWWALLFSSLIFGILHERWLVGTIAGMAYGLVYRRRGELIDAIVAHAVTNGLIAILVLSNDSWSLWS